MGGATSLRHCREPHAPPGVKAQAQALDGTLDMGHQVLESRA